MHSIFQMDISLPWIDAAFTKHLKVYLNIFIFHPRYFFQPLTTELGQYVEWDRFVTLAGSKGGLRVTVIVSNFDYAYNVLITTVKRLANLNAVIILSAIIPRPLDNSGNFVKSVNFQLQSICQKWAVKFVATYKPFFKSLGFQFVNFILPFVTFI